MPAMRAAPGLAIGKHSLAEQLEPSALRPLKPALARAELDARCDALHAAIRAIDFGGALTAACGIRELLARSKSIAGDPALRSAVTRANGLLEHAPALGRDVVREAIDGQGRTRWDEAAEAWRVATRSGTGALVRPEAQVSPGDRLPALDRVAACDRSSPGERSPTSDDLVTGDRSPAGVRLRGEGEPLPFVSQIQASFGRHDVSRLRAHVDDGGRAAARALGARAFAFGDRIAFAQTPDLHTAAHEAAHAVQQRAGIDTASDDHERHADAVADRVVAGASAEALLDQLAPRGRSTAIVQRKPEGSHRARPALNPALERQLLDVATRPVATGDLDDAVVRLAEFEDLLFVLDFGDAAALFARLTVDPPPSRDRLAVAFRRAFRSDNRTRIVKRLGDIAKLYEPARPASGGDTPDLWSELAPGKPTVAVRLLGRIDAPRGVHLRSHPMGPKDGPVLPFDTLVAVSRETADGWYWVTALGDAHDGSSVTGSGFVERYHVASEMPEPTAHLYRVKPGDRLKNVAKAFYGEDFAENHDARLYVQAIYHANQGRDAVIRQRADLSVKREALDTTDLRKAKQLWREARVVKGQALWIPSEAFVQRLEASGAIHHASMTQQVWDSTIGAVQDLVDWAQYTAGFAVGLLEGGWGALRDLFTGAVDLANMLWSVIKAIVGDFSELEALAKKLGELWQNRGAILEQIATDFMAKWQSKNDWDRGTFQGELVGYVTVLAFITLVTFGEGTVIAGAGRFGSFIKLIQLADAAGSLGTYVKKLKHLLPGHAARGAEQALAGKAVKAATGGGDPPHPHGHGPDAARAPDAHPPDAGTHAPDAHPPDAHAPDHAPHGSHAGPYADPRVHPELPAKRLDKKDLLKLRKLRWAKSWKEVVQAAKRGESVAVGTSLKTAEEGHAIMQQLAHGDARALEKLGIKDLPPGFDPLGNEWALVEARNGFAIFAGQYNVVELPVEVRSLGHVHPGTMPNPHVRKDTISYLTTDLDVPEAGAHYADILKDESKAIASGITPSHSDIHAISNGTDHVIYTRFVHLGRGKIGNPLPGSRGSPVSLHLSNTRVKRWNPGTAYYYEVDVVVKDAAGNKLWSDKMYALWVPSRGTGNMHPTLPDTLRNPPGPGWIDR